MTDHNTRIREYIDQVWNQSNLQLLPSFICPQYTLYHHPGDPWNGQTLDLDRFKQRFAYYKESLPDLRISIQEIAHSDENVITCWILTGTHLGNGFPGIPATGRSVKFTGMTLFYFHDHLIRGHWQEQDSLDLYNQLDVI